MDTSMFTTTVWMSLSVLHTAWYGNGAVHIILDTVRGYPLCYWLGLASCRYLFYFIFIAH
ncbi:hypothetical protein BDV06DRAFT_187524 [Aspergillus oleicola]